MISDIKLWPPHACSCMCTCVHIHMYQKWTIILGGMCHSTLEESWWDSTPATSILPPITTFAHCLQPLFFLSSFLLSSTHRDCPHLSPYRGTLVELQTNLDHASGITNVGIHKALFCRTHQKNSWEALQVRSRAALCVKNIWRVPQQEVREHSLHTF